MSNTDFLNGILAGKIDNKYYAEREYRKRWKLLDIIDGVKYTVFGVMFPTDEEQPEMIDMLSELETKNLLNKKIKNDKD